MNKMKTMREKQGRDVRLESRRRKEKMKKYLREVEKEEKHREENDEEDL